MPGVRIPTADEERQDPAAAHEVYEACVKRAIALTRGDRLFHQENINYGFRRNLWGLKPIGIAIAAASAVVLGFPLYVDFSAHAVVSPLVAICEVLNLAMLMVWIGWVKPRAACIAANAYAERLFDAIDALDVREP